MPLWLQAGLWGALAESALLLGAAIGYFGRVSQRIIAGVMAFGAGVLVSALSFDLMEEAYRRGGFDATAIGFLGGAGVYTLANWFLTRRGAQHRKRSGDHQASEGDHGGSGAALAIGALLDGVPESIAIGVSMIQGGTVSAVTVAAIFLSNVPEGMSSACGMRNAGRSRRYIFGVWGGIAMISGLAALTGYALFSGLSPDINAATIAVAAGAILTMLADTMLPEAFASAHEFTGIITVAGFLAAFLSGEARIVAATHVTEQTPSFGGPLTVWFATLAWPS
jgi:ZIP family zinc transporter